MSISSRPAWYNTQMSKKDTKIIDQSGKLIIYTGKKGGVPLRTDTEVNQKSNVQKMHNANS